MSRVRAFTLVEIVLVVTIILLMMSLAIPSLSGLSADRRLHKTLDDFGNVVRTARERSVAERRAYLVIADGKKFEVRPEFMTKDEPADDLTSFSFKTARSIKISFPAALTKNPPGQWVFWPTGTCEPAIVEFSGKDGRWTAKYTGLSVEPRLTNYATR